MLEIIILAISGALVGILSAFFGIGGGSFLVPLLYLVYPDFTNPQIISVSLGVILFATINNSRKFYKEDLLPKTQIIGIFGVVAIFGAIIGTEISYLLSKDISRRIIGGILILMVFRSLLEARSNKPPKQQVESNLGLGITGFLGTLVAAFTGLGGGLIFTPAFKYILAIPPKKISAYSNIAMLFGCFFALVPHGINGSVSWPYLGQINLQVVLIISCFTLLLAPIGHHLNATVSEKIKSILLNTLFVLLAIKLLA